MLQFAIPCLLGLESLVGDEVKKLGLADVRVENGRVLCRGEERDLARLNINLRCGARVLMELGSFPARAEELAARCGTITNELLSRLGRRLELQKVPRSSQSSGRSAETRG